MRKKILWMLVMVSVGTLVLAGCGKRTCGDAPVENESSTELTSEVSYWGVTLTPKDVTPEGMTIACTQSGDSPSGELNTGSYYVLEQEVQGVWCVVEYAEDARSKEIGWTAEAWMIPMNDTVEWEVDWEWLYGSLEPGHYRIGKEVMDFRGTGDYDKEMYYAEFDIEE